MRLRSSEPSHNSSPWVLWNEQEKLWFMYFHFYNHAHGTQQFRSIRTDAAASKMPGVMFWVYYRSEIDVTPDYLAKLAEHYYIHKKTDYFGDGKTGQLVTNAQFETLTGWMRAAGDGGSVERFRYESIPGLQNDHDDHGWSSHGEHGLKMVRGPRSNRASFAVSGLDTRMVYIVSAWVMADRPGRRAAMRITETDGRVIAEKKIAHAGRGTQWNEWSRITFNFTPTKPTVHIELHDEKASAGAVLYWDFVELEAAWPAE